MRLLALAFILVSLACCAEEAPLPEGALLRLGKPFMKRVGTRSAFAMAPEAGRAFEANGGDVAVWDVRTGQDVKRFHMDRDVLAVAISADGKRLAAALDNGGLVEWGEDGRDKQQTFDGISNEFQCLAFSPSGERLAAGYVWGSVIEFDVASGKKVREYEGIRDTVMALAWSPDGKRLCAGGSDKRARLWNTETGAVIAKLRGHKSDVRSAAFSPDGEELVTGCDDRQLHFWDGLTGKPRDTVGTAGWVHSVAWAPGGKSLAWTDSSGEIHLRERETGTERRVGKAASAAGNIENRMLAFAADGTLFAAGQDGRLDRWHVGEDGSVNGDLAHSAPVVHVAIAAGGAIATASEDGTVNLWRPDGSEPLAVGAAENSVAGLQFSPDGATLAVVFDSLRGLQNGQGVALWSSADATSIPFVADGVRSFAWSPDGTAVALNYGDGRLVVRVLASGSETTLDEFTADTDPMTLRFRPDIGGGIAFGPDGRRVFRADGSGEIDEFGLERGRRSSCLRSGKELGALAVSRDGRLLAARMAEGDLLVDVASGMAFGRMPAPLSLAPNAPLFAEVSGPYLRVKRVGKDKEELASVELPSIPRSVAWSPDGRRLVTGLDDGSAFVWDAEKLVRSTKPPAAGTDSLDALLDRTGLPNPETAWDASYRASTLPGCAAALAARLDALAKADPSSVAPLVRRLGDDDPEERNKAEADLREMGPRAARDLEAARSEATDAEAKARLEAILADWERGAARGPALGWLRAVMILEWLAPGADGTKAKSLLSRLQTEAPWARVRNAASEALQRVRAK